MSFILDIFWAVALSHMAFLSHNCSGEKMPLAEVLEARREQAEPEAQRVPPGPPFPLARDLEASCLHFFLLRLLMFKCPQSQQMPGPGAGEASLGCFMWHCLSVCPGWEGGGSEDALTLDSPCLGPCACFMNIYYFSDWKRTVKQDEGIRMCTPCLGETLQA